MFFEELICLERSDGSVGISVDKLQSRHCGSLRLEVENPVSCGFLVPPRVRI